MKRLSRRLAWALVCVVLVLLASAALFQFSTEVALERAEAARFRRMLVTRRGEEGANRFSTSRIDQSGNGTASSRRASRASGSRVCASVASIRTSSPRWASAC
jgi:hypothetical protein